MNKLILFISIFLNSCVPQGPHKPMGGEEPVGTANVGYENVRPLFANYCAACHPSRSGPDWLDYTQAQTYARNGKLAQRVVQEKTMPPPGSAQAAAITEGQRKILGAWARAGGPQRAGAPGEVAPTPPLVDSESEKLARQCLHCHGAVASGPAPQTKFPFLAGQNKEYLVDELLRFKWRARIDPSQVMNDVAADLSDHEIEVLARYYATERQGSLSARGAEIPPELRVLYESGRAKAEAECLSCHANSANNGRPLDPRIPVLAGQSKKYLINQLLYFRDHQRPGSIMLEMAKSLSNKDIEALALYFSSL